MDQHRNPSVLASCSMLLLSMHYHGSSWQEADHPLKMGIKNVGREEQLDDVCHPTNL